MTAGPVHRPQRRALVLGAASGLVLLHTRPLRAATPPAELLQAVARAWAGGQPITEGRLQLEVAPLVENGNAVPLRVFYDSPPRRDGQPPVAVQEIVVFNERNPQRDVVRFTFGPASGRAQADTRIRLATSQQLMALARLGDGSLWSQHVDVIVTLAACVEG